MDKDRVAGKAKEVEGRLQKAGGDLTGSDKAQRDGSAKIAEGKIQQGVGKAKDAVRKVIDKI